MSKKSVAPAPAKSKPHVPEKPPEPRPTRMEAAEQTVCFVDFAVSMDEDLVRVVVAAANMSRALQLSIKGLPAAMEHNELSEEDLAPLDEMASGLQMFCDQAKRLIAAGPGAEPWTSTAAKGGAR